MLKAIFRWIFFISVFLFGACSPDSTESYAYGKETLKTDSLKIQNSSGSGSFVSESDSEEIDRDFTTYYIVVADTGMDYFLLHNKMFELSEQLNIPIDTMDRYYNKAKDLIALSDDDEDDIYAGEYYPRRFPSAHLSLEYLDFYTEKAGKKTIALVSGLYETDKSADSALAILKKAASNSFTLKSLVYVGCMH